MVIFRSLLFDDNDEVDVFRVLLALVFFAALVFAFAALNDVFGAGFGLRIGAGFSSRLPGYCRVWPDFLHQPHGNKSRELNMHQN